MLGEKLPGSVFTIPDATYLAWIELRRYLPAELDLTRYFAEAAGVLLEGPDKFVADADGHIRLNVACPVSVVDEAVDRIVTATLQYRG